MKDIIKICWLFYLFFGFLSSCEKNNTNPNDKDPDISGEELKIVIAGIHDSADFYLLYNPTVMIEEKETDCLIYSGTDSLIIDNNNSSDLIFHSMTQVPDILEECCNCPDDPETICDCWPTGRIYKCINTIDTIFQIACNSNNRAISFEFNDTIETWSKWISNNWITLIDNYNYPPPERIYGNWNSMDDRYLGVRKIGSDTLHGWIKLNLSETIEIKELYFESK